MGRLLLFGLLLALAPVAVAATAGERRLGHRAHSGKAKGTTVSKRDFNGPRTLRLVVTTKPRARYRAFGTVVCRTAEDRLLKREIVRRARGRIELRLPLPKGAGTNPDCAIKAGGLYLQRNERGIEVLTALGKVRMTATLFGSANPPIILPETLTLEHELAYEDEPFSIETNGIEVRGNPPVRRAYAWERCDAGGNACAEIAGATEDRYVSTAADVGHRLRGRVSVSTVDGRDVAHTQPSPVIAKRG